MMAIAKTAIIAKAIANSATICGDGLKQGDKPAMMAIPTTAITAPLIAARSDHLR